MQIPLPPKSQSKIRRLSQLPHIMTSLLQGKPTQNLFFPGQKISPQYLCIYDIRKTQTTQSNDKKTKIHTQAYQVKKRLLEECQHKQKSGTTAQSHRVLRLNKLDVYTQGIHINTSQSRSRSATRGLSGNNQATSAGNTLQRRGNKNGLPQMSLQYSTRAQSIWFSRNLMDRRAWGGTVHGVTQSRT